MINKKIYIYSFYRFKSLTNIKLLKAKLEKALNKKLVLGTVLLANEGINGTVSGAKEDLEKFISQIKVCLKIRKLSLKVSGNQFIPFYRLKIRLKKEIVTIGDKSSKPEIKTGKHISPKSWDKMINDKKYLIIDTRNHYEVDIGTFKNAINPRINSFRDFPEFIKKLNIEKNQQIAMFCTGGIRCEKASSYLIKNGYKNINQLDGGILNYLECNKGKSNSSWEGECFVFDNRVSVNKSLKKGIYDQCYGCRHPILEKDKLLKSYVKGVSCKKCYRNKTKRKMDGSITRQKQIEAAEKLDLEHSFKKIYSILN